MLKGKTVVLGVTGSIAAYKIANLASMLSKLHADIHVLMTQNATNFINPITFETLTGNKCLIDTFDRNFQFNVEHVSLAKKADVVLIAPASANVIGKLANGIADDMLTTTVMACKCKKIISPAMNTNMYENSIVQDNIAKLKRFGMQVIEPDVGLLACKDVGAGKMPSEDTLLDFILQEILFIKAAAVADYTPENTADEKIKKKDGDEMSIPLKRTKDILKTLGENKKEKQFICGFSMETQNMLENSKKKLEKKNVDMIVANNLKVEGAGFGTDTNIVTLITKDEVRKLPQMSKEDVAAAILDGIVEKIY